MPGARPASIKLLEDRGHQATHEKPVVSRMRTPIGEPSPMISSNVILRDKWYQMTHPDVWGNHLTMADSDALERWVLAWYRYCGFVTAQSKIEDVTAKAYRALSMDIQRERNELNLLSRALGGFPYARNLIDLTPTDDPGVSKDGVNYFF